MREWMREPVLGVPEEYASEHAFIMLNRVTSPADYPLAAEKTRLLDTGAGVEAALRDKGSEQGRIHLRHAGSSNMLFADGHVEGSDRAKIEEPDIVDHVWGRHFEDCRF